MSVELTPEQWEKARLIYRGLTREEWERILAGYDEFSGSDYCVWKGCRHSRMENMPPHTGDCPLAEGNEDE